VYAAGLQRALAAVPSAVFSSNLPGKPKYSLPARVSCLGVKFLEYSLAGMVCGFVGQGMANGMMRIKCVPWLASLKHSNYRDAVVVHTFPHTEECN
jgi:hypothetical protein